ncbi:hypothetical protein [Teredinibacter turnerae]|uniref:Uncharacterized protein n=1 Tax=Teredinibacter turnerae (strain ATCC 39867 / T7901) TaxID=377629 RepID=C5BN01_TERTT|nr:hypothetical protein [Teredinibacter turnerae]ACR12662.1 hypothetical protein TERTU_0495 [Teredinibacter turnerae T7901]
MLNHDVIAAFFRWLLGMPEQPQMIRIPVEEDKRVPPRRRDTY